MQLSNARHAIFFDGYFAWVLNKKNEQKFYTNCNIFVTYCLVERCKFVVNQIMLFFMSKKLGVFIKPLSIIHRSYLDWNKKEEKMYCG